MIEIATLSYVSAVGELGKWIDDSPVNPGGCDRHRGLVQPQLPPFTPQMNARMENFIRAIKTECLDKIIFSSAAQLRYTVNQYLEYWNHYRPHAGLGGAMVKPYEQDMTAPIKEVSFLGGLLHGYRRERMAA